MKAKIQVVICKCCSEIPALLNTERLAMLATDADMVVSVKTVDAVCDGKDLAPVINEAKEKEVDRAVVLACHKKDVSPALLKTYRRAGVNEFMVNIVNLREEVVLPHSGQQELAQAKAEAMLRAALVRAVMLEPLEKQTEEMKTNNVVIIGAGASGQAAARAAAKTGVHTVILEKTGKSMKAPGVIMPNSQLIGATGWTGNYTLKIKAGEKVEDLGAAAVIVATGGGWTELKGPLAKAVKDAVPLYKLYEQMKAN